MNENEWLAEQFQANRARLRAVARRMLGSVHEADDAVQEAWLRMSRHGPEGIANPAGWMTTIVARVCLDLLRSRQTRREEPLDGTGPDDLAAGENIDPAAETLLVESVGVAMLVVLETLTPAERLAFVLHDMFGISFDEIGRIAGRSPAAARQLASRARRRVRGTPTAPDAEIAGQRRVVDAFLAAARSGDVAALVALLDPQVVSRADATAAPEGSARELRGAEAVAQQTRSNAARARFAQAALVGGAMGIVVAPGGRLRVALRLGFAHGRIAVIEAIGDPARLRRLKIALLRSEGGRDHPVPL